MIQYQIWDFGLNILITQEHGSIQVIFPISREYTTEYIADADCIFHTLWVDEEYRRKGIGKALLKLAEETSKKKGGYKVCLAYNKITMPYWVLEWFKSNNYLIENENNKYLILTKKL